MGAPTETVTLAAAVAKGRELGLRAMLVVEPLFAPWSTWADGLSFAEDDDMAQFFIAFRRMATHYALLGELLGVERDATPAQIKRSYIQAAKRLHPDALSRLGLAELKTEANEVFAEIAKAQATLLDVDRRRSYDASLDGHSDVDANQVAQAKSA